WFRSRARAAGPWCRVVACEDKYRGIAHRKRRVLRRASREQNQCPVREHEVGMARRRLILKCDCARALKDGVTEQPLALTEGRCKRRHCTARDGEFGVAGTRGIVKDNRLLCDRDVCRSRRGRAVEIEIR